MIGSSNQWYVCDLSELYSSLSFIIQLTPNPLKKTNDQKKKEKEMQADKGTHPCLTQGHTSTLCMRMSHLSWMCLCKL